MQDAHGGPGQSAATDEDLAPQAAVAASTGASDAHDSGARKDTPAAKQDIAVVSATDASGGKGGGAAGCKPRPDALHLSFLEYRPIEHACWEPGQPTPYLHLAQAFQVR